MKNFLTTCFLLFIVATASAQLSQNGLLFDGVDDRVKIPNNAAYNVGNGNISIEAWIRADVIGASNIWEYIVSTYAGNSSGFGLAITYAGNLSFTINGSGYGSSTTINLRDGLCHHVAVVRKDTSVSYYIDGALSPGNAAWSASINTTNPLYISNPNPNTSSPSFKGLIKEVRIWNVARTQGELLSNMNAVPAAGTTGLIGYWRMNATSGQTVTDYSLTANNGVLGTTSSAETLDPAFSTGCPSCTQTTAVVTAGGSTSFCIGDSVLLSANTGLGFTYQWYRDGVAISGATNATYYAKLTGAHSVKLTNSGGCSSYSNAISIYQLLDNAGGIGCDGITVGPWACLNGGNTRTLKTGTGPGYTYQWKKNGVNIPGAVNFSYSTTLPGAYTCLVTAGGCSRTTSTFTLGPNPVTLTANGPTTMCTGSVSLSISYMYGTASGVTYDWKKNGVSFSAPNAGFYPASQTGSYTCTVSDPVCPGSFTSNAVAVTMGQLPDVYIGPGATQVISECGFTQVDLFLEDVNGDSYPTSDPSITAIDWFHNSISIPFPGQQIAATESGIYSAYVMSNVCSPVGTTQPKIVLLTNQGPVPQVYYSTLSHCSQVSLSVDSYWLGYQWKLNGNTIAGATTYSYTATQSGSYTCELFNACGSVTTTAVQVTISGTGTPVITAPNGTIICGTQTRSLVAPQISGTTYQWKLNGNNVANGTSYFYNTNVPGNYTCQVTNSCGTFLSNVITLTAPAIPAAPGAISGAAKPCPGTNNLVYSIAAVPNAWSYTWIIPAGSGITYVSGLGTTSITVNIASTFTAATILVRASNICGASSANVSKSLTSKLPAQPGSITGGVNGVCASTQTYSIPSVSQATSYLWSVPSGASIVGGQGTTSVSVSFGSAYGADSIRVSAVNTCGSSMAKAKYVKGRPAIPTAITGTVNVCAGQTGLNYSIAPVYGATTYTWTKPTGATITNGQGTTQLTMTMGSASGTLKVKSVNSCGSSSNKTLGLNVVCRGEEDVPEKVLSMRFENGPQQLMVYPSGCKVPADVILYDSMGRQIGLQRSDAATGIVFNNLSSGVYLVELRSGGERVVGKVMVN